MVSVSASVLFGKNQWPPRLIIESEMMVNTVEMYVVAVLRWFASPRSQTINFKLHVIWMCLVCLNEIDWKIYYNKVIIMLSCGSRPSIPIWWNTFGDNILNWNQSSPTQFTPHTPPHTYKTQTLHHHSAWWRVPNNSPSQPELFKQ